MLLPVASPAWTAWTTAHFDRNATTPSLTCARGQGYVHGDRKDRGNFAFQSQRNAWLPVLICRATIDNDIRNTASRRQQRKGGSGIYRKRGTQRDNEICTLRGGFRALQNERIEALPKANGGRFQVTATGTKRRTSGHSKSFEEGLWISTP